MYTTIIPLPLYIIIDVNFLVNKVKEIFICVNKIDCVYL